MGRVVGIDFGMARLGLAISDEKRIIAQPLLALKAGKDFVHTAQLLAKELARYSNIDCIVLGLPLLLSGKEGDMAIKVKAFKGALEQQFGIPVILWDERLTSQQVDRFLKSADMKRKQRSQVCDALAAAAILENYLSSQQ
ncbi:MAG TPA: Holliday junction resolvase RuvX [Rhabdochlamydiaceae bacterium]